MRAGAGEKAWRWGGGAGQFRRVKMGDDVQLVALDSA
jgi:hypothetical protein